MDSDLWIQILELVILLALSGFFSSAETAMVSVSKIRLRTLEDEGNKKEYKDRRNYTLCFINIDKFKKTNRSRLSNSD